MMDGVINFQHVGACSRVATRAWTGEWYAATEVQIPVGEGSRVRRPPDLSLVD